MYFFVCLFLWVFLWAVPSFKSLQDKSLPYSDSANISRTEGVDKEGSAVKMLEKNGKWVLALRKRQEECWHLAPVIRQLHRELKALLLQLRTLPHSDGSAWESVPDNKNPELFTPKTLQPWKTRPDCEHTHWRIHTILVIFLKARQTIEIFALFCHFYLQLDTQF